MSGDGRRGEGQQEKDTMGEKRRSPASPSGGSTRSKEFELFWETSDGFPTCILKPRFSEAPLHDGGGHNRHLWLLSAGNGAGPNADALVRMKRRCVPSLHVSKRTYTVSSVFTRSRVEIRTVRIYGVT